jgi:hypothetical protein
MKKAGLLITLIFIGKVYCFAQNFTFDFNTSGRRVCPLETRVDTTSKQVKLFFLDSASNTTEPLEVNKRLYGSNIWVPLITLPAGTGHWVDNAVNNGEVWEYQVKRQNTWNYGGTNYTATGYTIGSLAKDNTGSKGRLILLVANDVVSNLSTKYTRLKKELTADGWLVQELIVPRATNWDSQNEVVSIKNNIVSLYNTAPINDKPKCIFILGHVPLPRSGSTAVTAPDEHDENKGARGADVFYADTDGSYTDNATYNPGGLATGLAINQPNDFKWDQDFFPSDIEMAFGRVDFAELTDNTAPELTLISNYLDRLSNYRNVASGFDMGEKTGFYFGYDNSNDGSYRSLPNISKAQNVYQNYSGSPHNTFVQNNGPFKIYMQNLSVPDYVEWEATPMNATVYTSDQSYWGFGDVPQTGIYSRIRSLLTVPSKCLVTLWTTTGINIFHQACAGEPFGVSLKPIMNHNQTNNYLEKPSQEYDTPNWWNRTHFAYYGDPSINLYQVAPPTNTLISNVGNIAQLTWVVSPSANVLGYNVYESATEFGSYTKVNSSMLTTNNYNIPNYNVNKWYLVKAIKYFETGCGTFLHASMGAVAKGNFVLSLPTATTSSILEETKLGVYPNPARNVVTIKAKSKIAQIKVYDASGKYLKVIEGFNNTQVLLEAAQFNSNVLFITVQFKNGLSAKEKIVVMF